MIHSFGFSESSLSAQWVGDVGAGYPDSARTTNEGTGATNVNLSSEMHDYDTQKWFGLYKTALLELERAAMTGRIDDARVEITTRLETLREHPSLHEKKYLAIRDALNNLHSLEREEARMAAEDKTAILQRTVQTLKTIAPRFGEPEPEHR